MLGQNTLKDQIKYDSRFANVFCHLIVMMIGIPFALGLGNKFGKILSFTFALIFSFIYSFLDTLNQYLPTIIDSLATSVEIAINAVAEAIYKHSDAISDAIQTLFDVITVKLKESDSWISYLVDDTDYLVAKVRLGDKFEEAGDEAGEAAGEAITESVDDSVSGYEFSSFGTDGASESGNAIGDMLGSYIGDGVTDKLNNLDFTEGMDSISFDNLPVNVSSLDFSDTSSIDYESLFSTQTDESNAAYENMADENAQSYFNELDSEFSAAAYAQYGLGGSNVDDIIDSEEEAGAAGGSAYGDSYTEEIENYDGSGVVEGIVDWTTNEDAVETIKKGGEDGATNYIEGFKQGIYNMSESLRKAVIDAINGNVNETAKDTLGEESPSKISYGYAVYYLQGFANALSDKSYLLSDAVTESFSGVNSDMESSLAHINAIVNNALDYEPTITPVLDTSNISEQAGWLDQTLDGQYSMSLAAQNQLEIDHANESSLARQIEDLRTSVQALANKDYSKILEGVNINVDASTNVDGKPLYSKASKHTIQVIDDQERSYIMAKGGRV